MQGLHITAATHFHSRWSLTSCSRGTLYNMGGKRSPHRVADLVWESLCRNNYLESSDVYA